MHMISLLQIKNLSPNQLHHLPPPLTDEEVERFDDNDNGIVHCTPKKLLYWLQQELEDISVQSSFLWCFCHSFLKCIEDRFYKTFDLLPEYLTKEKVGIALDAHVDYICRGYKKLDKPPTSVAAVLKLHFLENGHTGTSWQPTNELLYVTHQFLTFSMLINIFKIWAILLEMLCLFSQIWTIGLNCKPIA